MEKNYEAKYPIQSVERAIEIMLFLRNNSTAKGLSLIDISNGLGINKSSVHRFLDTLMEYNFVEKNSDGSCYKLSWGAFELGCNVPKFNGLDSEAVSLSLKELSNHFGEIINLGIRNNDSMIIIKRFFPDDTFGQKLITNVRIGEREPLYCTGIGKLFLSEMSDEAIINDFRLNHSRCITKYSITDEAALLKEISAIRKNDYALDDRESSEEIFCIAVPLRDYTGKIAAGISISVPYGHFNEEETQKTAQLLKSAAKDISLNIGFEAYR